jgi:hypothetical protein
MVGALLPYSPGCRSRPGRDARRRPGGIPAAGWPTNGRRGGCGERRSVWSPRSRGGMRAEVWFRPSGGPPHVWPDHGGGPEDIGEHECRTAGIGGEDGRPWAQRPLRWVGVNPAGVGGVTPAGPQRRSGQRVGVADVPGDEPVKRRHPLPRPEGTRGWDVSWEGRTLLPHGRRSSGVGRMTAPPGSGAEHVSSRSFLLDGAQSTPLGRCSSAEPPCAPPGSNGPAALVAPSGRVTTARVRGCMQALRPRARPDRSGRTERGDAPGRIQDRAQSWPDTLHADEQELHTGRAGHPPGVRYLRRRGGTMAGRLNGRGTHRPSSYGRHARPRPAPA